MHVKMESPGNLLKSKIQSKKMTENPALTMDYSNRFHEPELVLVQFNSFVFL